MDLVRTSIGIGKTIRNVARLREILSVFARNGLDEFIIQTGLHQKIPGFVLPKKRIEKALSEIHDEADLWNSIAYRLRKSFEELGPGFIKLGQLISTREDLFPPSFIDELKLLQNKVEGISFESAKAVIEKNLEKKIEDVFIEFNHEPIGRASIGVVYKAKLHDGSDVVVKVKRPGIDSVIRNDFEVLRFLVAQLEKISTDIKYLGVSRALYDFERSILLELNFNIEAQNCLKLKENIKRVDEDQVLVIPGIYEEYSSEEMLVMDLIKGRPFNELSADEVSETLKKNLDKSVHLFLHTLLADGFFHADLHGGNFFLLENDQIGIIDFGLMGVLSKKNRASLVAILYAMMSNNYENLVYEFLEVADYDEIPNEDKLIQDIRDCLQPFIGLSVQQTNVAELISAVVKTLSSHQLYLPREWFIIFRALMTLDGVGKSIGIDLNIFEVIDGDLSGIMDEVLSQKALKEEVIWLGRDVLNSLRTIPRHMRWFTKDFSREGYHFKHQIEQLDKVEVSIQKSFYFLGLNILCGVFVFAGLFFISDPANISIELIPNISWFFWMLALAMFVRANLVMKSKLK